MCSMHGSEEAKEGRGSHDDSAGCELEETTMLTDNEPALGALVVVVARLKEGIRMAAEHSPADQSVTRDVERCTRDCHGGYHVLDVLIWKCLQKFKSLRVGIFRSMIGPLPPHADEV